MKEPLIPESTESVDRHQTSAGHESTLLGDFAHATAEGLGSAIKGAHAVGKHIPGVLHQLEQVSEVITDLCHDTSSQNPVENAVCGTLAGVAKVGVGVVAAAGLVLAPEIEVPLIAEAGVLTAATLEAMTAGTIGIAVQKTVAGVTKPVGDVVSKVCHAAFDYCQGDKTPQKTPSNTEIFSAEQNPNTASSNKIHSEATSDHSEKTKKAPFGQTPTHFSRTYLGSQEPSRFSRERMSNLPTTGASSKEKPAKPRVNRAAADAETEKVNRSSLKAINSGHSDRSSTMPPRTQKSKTAHFSSSNVEDRKTAGLMSDTINQYRQFAEAIRKIESNPTAATRVYDMERLVEHYSQYMRKNVAHYRGSEHQSGITDLASSFYVSPSTFHHNARLVGDITFKFLNESHPETKGFVEKTVLHLQLDYLDEIKTLSEVSVVDTTDTINSLMDAAKIPPHARPFFHQQCLSMLARAQLTSETEQVSSETVRVDSEVLHQLHAQKNAEYNQIPQQPLSEAERAQHFKALEQSNKKISSIAHKKEPSKDLTTAEREQWVALKKQTDEISETLKKQQSEQETQKTIAGQKASAQFISMLGNVTEEPIIQDAGTLFMAGALAYEAHVGFSALTTASSFGACLGPIAIAGMAALTVVGLFCKQKRQPQSDEAYKQIMQALAQIMSKLDVMHKEMHQRFDRLEGIELETRRQMLLGFDAVIAELHTVADLEVLQFHALEKIDAKVSAALDEMHAGFEGVQDTLIQPTIETILNPTQKQFLAHLDAGRYATYIAQLTHFLIATSCLPAYNGSDQIARRNGKYILDHNAIANTLSGQSESTGHAKKQLNGLLGLLAILANEQSGAESYVSQPQSLPNPTQWELGLLAYEKLLRAANPQLQRDKEAHLGTIHTLTKKAEKIQTFLHHVAQDKTLSASLIKKLVENYHNNLNDIEKLIQHHLEKQEKEFYKKFCIQVRPGERLLKLDESFNEARKRQNTAQFLEQCENSAVNFSAEMTFIQSDLRHVAVSPYVFHPSLERPNSKMFNAIHGTRHQFGDAAQLAWANFKEHCTTFVNPTVTSNTRLSILASHIALAVKLQRVNIIKKYHVEVEEVSNPQTICSEFPKQTREHDNHEFTRRVSNRFSFQLSSVDDKKQITLFSGSKVRPVRDYWPFIINDHEVDQEVLALYLATFWIASGAPNWGDTTIEALGLGEFESFFKTIAVELHDLMKPYRVAAIQELRLNVEFQAALEKLESSALQLHAFSNLLDINWGSLAKPWRAEWINAQLTNIAQAGSNNAIVLLQDLLKKLLDKDALKVNSLVSAIPANIEGNPLYAWAKNTMDALANLATTVGAWPDVAAEQDDATVLDEKLEAFTSIHHSSEEQEDYDEVATDDEEIEVLEEITREYLDANDISQPDEAEALWVKPDNEHYQPGERILSKGYLQQARQRVTFFNYLQNDEKGPKYAVDKRKIEGEVQRIVQTKPVKV